MKYLSIMIFARFLFLATACFVLISCTNNLEVRDDDTKATEALIGVWRGAGTYKDGEDAGWAESWKMVRKLDSTYKVNYLIVNDAEKQFEQSSDTGTWKYEDGVYYEVNSNGAKTTYDVFSLKLDRFEYNLVQRLGSINIKEIKTVDNFQLKGPPEDYLEVSYGLPRPQDQIRDLHLVLETSVEGED